MSKQDSRMRWHNDHADEGEQTDTMNPAPLPTEIILNMTRPQTESKTPMPMMCPFCGQPPILKAGKVKCANNQCKVQPKTSAWYAKGYEDNAVNDWNERISDPAPLPIGKQFIEDLEPICADDGKRCKGTHPIICQDHGCAILAQREAVAGAAEKLRQNACGTAAALLGDTSEKTPIRPTAAGRWVVRVRGGDDEIMHVIDIDENRVRMFAVNSERLVRSVEWFSEVGGVEWVRPEAFPVSPSVQDQRPLAGKETNE